MNQEHISPPSPISNALLPYNKKSRATLFKKVTRLPVRHPGNPAISLRPVAFRPLLTKSLALSWNYFTNMRTLYVSAFLKLTLEKFLQLKLLPKIYINQFQIH
jgi:hypothetical protein